MLTMSIQYRAYSVYACYVLQPINYEQQRHAELAFLICQ